MGLGSGGGDYIWPGVPDDLPGAVGFFAAQGWRFDHTAGGRPNSSVPAMRHAGWDERPTGKE